MRAKERREFIRSSIITVLIVDVVIVIFLRLLRMSIIIIIIILLLCNLICMIFVSLLCHLVLRRFAFRFSCLLHSLFGPGYHLRQFDTTTTFHNFTH